ncbi:hypothetical protein CVT26_013777 [Gymnopilus dilepis]|uniref:Glutamine amidotransferase domain-containing protein n=1 Tax=Gymnopilus dilepis TaxID=231916 RepID=A0A409Y6E5_9AGAR|nr:hypothetical protein CVT26_013777 [Gymnopilus dilepis]
MPKLALFLCGNLSGAALSQNGSYTDIYTAYLQSTAPPECRPFSLDAYDVREGHFPDLDQEDSYHAIILTGSAANAYDNLEWINTLVAYIQRIASSKPHIRLIGICFGHQIIARALGGQCVPNDGRWEVGPTQIALTPLGRRVFGGRDTLVSLLPPFAQHSFRFLFVTLPLLFPVPYSWFLFILRSDLSLRTETNITPRDSITPFPIKRTMGPIATTHSAPSVSYPRVAACVLGSQLSICCY